MGEIRGGFSVAVPMAPAWADQMPDIIHRIIGYGGMWLLGLFGIASLSRHLQRQILARSVAEKSSKRPTNRSNNASPIEPPSWRQQTPALQNEIADRRQAEQWLLESEQRFRGYFEQGLVGMAILSADRAWVEVNGRLCRMLGYTEDELLLKTWKELTHPDDLAADESQFQRLVERAWPAGSSSTGDSSARTATSFHVGPFRAVSEESRTATSTPS